MGSKLLPREPKDSSFWHADVFGKCLKVRFLSKVLALPGVPKGSNFWARSIKSWLFSKNSAESSTKTVFMQSLNQFGLISQDVFCLAFVISKNNAFRAASRPRWNMKKHRKYFSLEERFGDIRGGLNMERAN